MKLKGLDKILLMSANAKQASATSRVDAHVAGTAEKHAAEKVTYSGSVVSATDVKQGIDLLKARVDEIITTPISGEAAAQELIDARGGKATLGDRFGGIDSQLAETAKQVDEVKFTGQTDFVDFIKSRTKYKNVSVKKISSPYNALSVFCSNGKEHVTHEFKKNANDDYWIYHVAFAGLISTLALYKSSTSAKTGIWSAVDGSGNIYTTEVGATFTASVQGEQITLNHMADSRGGIFSIVIDDDTENPITVSTYSDTLVVKNTIIATDLSDSVHTVVGTFLGADPDHTPTSTARGWIRDDQSSPLSDERYTLVGGVSYNGKYNSSSNKMLLAYASNKDWAFNFTKGAETHWFPEHNAQGTAFKTQEPKLFIDGTELDFNGMEDEKVYKGLNVQFIQKVECRFPNIVDPIAELEIVFTIGLDGVVSVSGYLKMLQNAVINNGYTMMFPLEQTVVDEFLSGIGTHIVNAGDSSNLNLPDEKDRTYSFAGVDSVNKDYIAAVSIDSPLKTLRYGLNGRGNPLYFIDQRAQYPKLYPLVFFNHSAVTGEKYNFNGRFAIGKIPDVYNYTK